MPLMNDITMKRILFLLSIAFLISCSNQQEPNTSPDPGKLTTTTQRPDADSLAKLDAGAMELEPEKLEMEEGEVKNDGYSSQEVSQLFRQATSAYDQGNFPVGIDLFKQITEKEPNDGRAYYNLGVGYFKLEKFGEAIKSFSKAISISPRDSLSYQYRGRVYYMMGDYKNCLYDYSRVVELKPDDPIAYYNRGTAKGRTNDYIGAIEDFDRSIALNPDYAEAYYNRGLANFYRGMLHDACFDWNKAYGLGHYNAEKAIKDYCEGKEN